MSLLARLQWMTDTQGWDVVVTYGQLALGYYAVLHDVSLDAKHAVVTVNSAYAFTDASYWRAVTHELLELASYRTWLVFLESLSYIRSPAIRDDLAQKMRDARDVQIDGRLAVVWDLLEESCVHPKENNSDGA